MTTPEKDLSSDDMMAILGQRVQAVYGFGLEEYIEARRAGTLPYKPGGAALEVFAGDFDTKAHADAERAEAALRERDEARDEFREWMRRHGYTVRSLAKALDREPRTI